ncbi:protein scarlet-like [Homalodisca vitripennis]|nr:protein scarlet-like [Homalodisca vitripennis]XP_046672916.1 protein scarlet-like [Homalodisca vitripennis]XP_046672917.1 protein scarlet-like [Homalodisca vitripennis]XP_046672918.1 protein scarlet-like [Homalodisca vitripennis]
MTTKMNLELPITHNSSDPNEDCLMVAGNFTLSWHNVSVWVKKKSVEKSTWFRQHYQDVRILNKVSGLAEPGSLVAIMGPSGAGKTTLLATISQRLQGDMYGQILINGNPITKQLMTRISGFVPQQDLTLRSLTVLEHMQLMARLKMDRRLQSSQRNRRVITLINELGLAKCSNTRLSSLSGGETKKVSLAVQMLTDPTLLFCDEPTTGLDSYSAGAVVERLRSLAVRGKTVICSIHQPTSGIFELFHSVILLAPGGELAYQGGPQHALAHFNSLNIVCPTSYNLAEFLVSQLNVTDDPDSQTKIQRICSKYLESDVGKEHDRKLEKLKQRKKQNNIIEVSNGIAHYGELEDEFQKYINIQSPTWFTQLYCLVWRSFVEIFRNPQEQFIRLTFYMFIGLLISTPYVGLSVDQAGIQNMQGCLYLVVVETIFTFTYSVFHTFPSEIPILLREIGNGLYTPGPYYISKMIVLLPRALLEPILYSAMVFWIAGLFGGFAGFIQFCVPVIACAVTGTAWGCLISATFESVATGSLISVPIEQICLMFCGIFLSISDAPMYLVWIKYISMFYYGLEAVSIQQWSEIDEIPCSENKNVPCISSGNDVLNNYGYSSNNFNLDLLGLGMLYCIAHIIGFVSFKQRSKKQAAY